MRKIVVAILLTQLFSVLSCTQKVEDTKNEYSNLNDTQMKYYELITLQNNALNGKPRKINKIQQELYLDSVQKAQKAFYKENPIFFNWIGTIKNINMTKKDNRTVIDFEISLKHPYDTIKIKFICRGERFTDSLSNYHIYNAIKNIPDYSKVYFTGFLGDEIIHNYLYKDLTSDDIQESFDIIDLSTTPLDDSYPQKIIEYFRLNQEQHGLINKIVHRVHVDKKFMNEMSRKNRTEKDYSEDEKEVFRLKKQIEDLYLKLSPELRNYQRKIDYAFSSAYWRHNPSYFDK